LSQWKSNKEWAQLKVSFLYVVKLNAIKLLDNKLE